jgi:photosystem II stability/assembly factor-like uncharacterized protein
MKSVAALCLIGFGALSATGATGAASAQQEIGPPSDIWQLPSCPRIIGSSALTFTSDDGATLTPANRPLQGTTYAKGLVALDTPNVLLGAVQSVLYRSTDAGCSWRRLADLSDAAGGELLTLTKAGGERAYTWSDNRGILFRVDGRTVTALKSPVTSIVGFGADPKNRDHARLGDGTGQLWETLDAGVTWNPLGAPAQGGVFAYRVAFDPASPDHAVAGTVVNGAFVTTDAGRTWSKATGLSKGDANIFNLVVSPADPQVVWAMGIDLDLVDTDPGQGRFIYRSTDGGLTYGPVVHQDPAAGINMQNGPTMAAHPTDPNLFYWAFGISFANYGTDFYKVDAATGQVTWTHNPYHGIGAIEFSPASPSLLYLGLELVKVQ